MNLQPIDWTIVAALMVVLTAGALSTWRATRSVSAFLAANRAGGRYLISVAMNMAALGVISLVLFFEQNYQVGFTSIWWGLMEGPIWIIMGLSGWVIYRYRQTRAMTLAQFLEMRYSRGVRVFSGLVAFLAGIINFGIFPSVGARFFIAFCGLPEQVALLGLEVDTFPLTMAVLLAVSLLFTFLGGQVAVMVTDFLQGIFGNLVFALLIAFLLWTFSWKQISTVLLDAPPNNSLVHPFHLGQEHHFNIWYYAISILVMFYSPLLWQGTSGYNCSAKSPHEAKMAGIIAGWRWRVLMLITLVVPICVRTFLQHPDFAADAQVVHSQLEHLQGASESETATLRNQLRAPYALAAILPAGMLGLVAAAMLAAFISTHDTYLHSWGSIFIQDVILPFRKKPLSARQHIWLLRLSIFGVALFIFLFSLLFHHSQYIAMYVAISGAIFFAGAGALVIGGLYWKRGTTAAAWTSLITGMCVSIGGILITQTAAATLRAGFGTPLLKPLCSFCLWLKLDLALTGQEYTFWAIVLAVSSYVLVSLIGPRRRAFNMDRLLHRGRYAVAGETSLAPQGARTWLEKLGFTREFQGRDKLVVILTLGYPLVWTAIFIAGTLYNLSVQVPDESWLEFWRWYTWITFAIGVIVTLWFTIGGAIDLRYLYRQLRSARGDELDDGRVREP